MHNSVIYCLALMIHKIKILNYREIVTLEVKLYKHWNKKEEHHV